MKPAVSASHRPFLRWAALLLLMLDGCAGSLPPLDSVREVRPDQGEPVRVLYAKGNEWDARLIIQAVARALPRLETWGVLREPVVILVYPTHEELTRAVRRPGYGWLRAWAQYDRVHIQAPSTWGGATTAPRVEEVIAHELAHVLMYQTIGDRETWAMREVPLWFREGLASVTAQQGQRRLKLPLVRERAAALPTGMDPIRDAEKLSRDHYALVYSLAHHMMEDVFDRCFPSGIRDLMRHMGEGMSFSASFDAHCPEPLDEFLTSWRDRLSDEG